MLHRQVMGIEGMILAALLSSGIIATAFFLGSHHVLTGDMGICLPSPNLWGMSPLMGWIANSLMLWVTVTTLYIVNREYNLVPGSDTVLYGLYVIMVSCNVWVSGELSSSGLLAFANLICLAVLFGCYRKRNASQELCVIATILSLGSMIQYAFIFMLPVYLLGAGFMKCLNFKGFIAYLFGIAAPYWVGVGMGIIPLEDFTMPTPSNMFSGFATRPQLFTGLVIIGITALIAIILALTNMVKLYAGNTQRRLCNLTINVLGLACVICIVFDAENLVSYLCTLYMICAIQFANMFALRNVFHGSRWVAAICVLYIAGFAAMITAR